MLPQPEPPTEQVIRGTASGHLRVRSVHVSQGRPTASTPAGVERVEFTLAPPQPFRLDLTALALVRRPNNRIDTWRDGAYRRWVPVSEPYGPGPVPQFLLEVVDGAAGGPLAGRPPPGSPTETLLVRAFGRLPEEQLAAAAERVVTHMFGLDVDLAPFRLLADSDGRLAPLAAQLEGLRPPRYPGVFQALLNAVPCQQVTLVLGLRLLEQMARTYGPAVHGANGGSEHDTDATAPLPLPDATTLAERAPEELVALGLSGAKARTLIELARECVSGRLDLSALPAASNEAASERLQRLFGIGRWTSDYVLLRGLGRLDVFPHGDSGARNGLARFMGVEGKPSYGWVADTVRPWEPYAGFVYLHLLVAGMVSSGAYGTP